MTYYYPRNRALRACASPELTGRERLTFITSAGQRPSEPGQRGGEKTNWPAGDLTSAAR